MTDFKVGDKVRIVDMPTRNTPDHLIGKIGIIQLMRDEELKHGSVKVLIDGGLYNIFYGEMVLHNHFQSIDYELVGI